MLWMEEADNEGESGREEGGQKGLMTGCDLNVLRGNEGGSEQ